MATRRYRLEFAPAAIRDLESLPRTVQGRLRPRIDALAVESRPRGAKKIQGETRYRIRIGDYRIVYEIQDKALLVLVVRIGHRRDVYRGSK